MGPGEFRALGHPLPSPRPPSRSQTTQPSPGRRCNQSAAARPLHDCREGLQRRPPPPLRPLCPAGGFQARWEGGCEGPRGPVAPGGPGCPAPPALTFSTPSSCLGLMSTPSIRSGADGAPLSAAFISSAVIAAPCAVYSGSRVLGARQTLPAAGLSARGSGAGSRAPTCDLVGGASLQPPALAGRSEPGGGAGGGHRAAAGAIGPTPPRRAERGGAGAGAKGGAGGGGEVSGDGGGPAGSGSGAVGAVSSCWLPGPLPPLLGPSGSGDRLSPSHTLSRGLPVPLPDLTGFFQSLLDVPTSLQHAACHPLRPVLCSPPRGGCRAL